MQSVVELFQEREEWMGQEEEVVEERREVGCQWEHPKEERKDVGCQSDSAERRDVAVQVDLLTQQLCGMAWRCVAVRAGEPGGGALLQHCGTPRSRGHTLLPIMPLCEPTSCPEPTQPESTDIQQTVPLPSTPPADASAAPPPGLIAPLSPRLAEEQEEEDDEVSSKKEISDSPVRVDEQSETAETKTKSEQQVQPTPRSSPIFQRRSRRTRSGGEKISQSEERRNVRITTRDMKRNIQTGRVETRRKHTRAARGEDKNMEAEKENKKLDEAMKMKRRRRRRRRSKEGNGLTPVKMNSEVTDRPRRKAVGPPIRYLLEYEEQARGKSAANHEEGRGLRGGEEKGRKEEMGRGMALKQLHLSVYRKGSRRRGTTIVRLRRLHHHNIRGRHLRNMTVSSGTQSVDGQEEKERRVQKRRRTMEKDGVMVRNRRRSRREEQGREVRRRKLEEKLAQRPRRTMVGPPIRYLLESEKTHGQEKTNQDVARVTGEVTKPQKKKKTEAEGEGLSDRTKTTELTEKKTESTNQDAACSHKRRVGRPKKVRVESEAVGGASGLTNLTVRTRRQQRLRRKRPSGRRCEDQMMELKRGEDEREVKEFPQRPRRTMVGPPIRYLLESEKTHGQETANKDVARVTGEVTKPQKKKKTEAEGEALGDRTKTTELTEKQKESTNQDTACSHKRRVGRPKKVRVDNEPSEGTKPTGETKRERQRRKRKGESERRSEDQTKEEGGEEEREEEVKGFPQRQRRTMVGPPIRYLIELEKTHSQETASQDVVRPTEGVTKPQKKKTEAEGGALGDRTKTTELTEKQMESTNQDAACSPTNRVRSPIKVKVESEVVGGASVGTEREELKRKEQSGRKSGDWTLELKGGEEERKEEVKEVPQSQRRTMVGPPLGLLLKSEEQSHDWEVAGSGQELNSQEKTKSGGGALDQETTVIDRPEDTEQKVRQTGETDTEMKTSLIIPDGPKRRRRRRPVKVRGQNEEGDRASEMTDGTEIKGQRGIQRSERKRKRGTEEEEVRQVFVNDREEEKTEKQTESPKRPRRTMVGPPIRYLLESEEQSHGQDTTNQGFACMKKLLKGNEDELKAVEDMEGAKLRAGTPRKVGDDGKTGGGASERQTDIGTRTGLHPQTDLIYFDPQSGQVSIFSPCCVRLQRLL